MATFLKELAAAAGSTAEEITQKLFEKVGGVPLERMAQPEETAELVYFLFPRKHLTLQVRTTSSMEGIFQL